MRTKIYQQIEVWKRDLIDLTRRNALLNTSSRAVGFVIEEPRPTQVLASLFKGKLLSIQIPRSEEVGGNGELSKPSERSEPSLERPVVVNMEPSSQEYRKNPVPLRADEIRTSLATSEKALATLRSLKRKSDQEFLDKGLRILYLAFGSLNWNDRDEDDSWSSTILLIPIELISDGHGAFGFRISDEDECVVNPALIEKLRVHFGDSRTFSPQFDEDNPEAILEVFDDLARSYRGWSVAPTLRVGLYSFSKEVIYRDLSQHADLVAGSELVHALAFGSEANANLSFPKLEERELDKRFPPSRLNSILDADSTQRQAIIAAKQGRSFVIDGPPGTGKSQTIANIISELIGDGKSVLFVSEKAAALEVVQNRLEAAGLASFLLPLHSQKISRKAFAGMLMKAANERTHAGKKLSDDEIWKLNSAQQKLSDYSSAMNEERLPLGRSLYNVIGEYIQLEQHSLAPIPKDAIDAGSTSATFSRIESLVVRMSHLWGSIENPGEYEWRGLSDPKSSDSKRSEIFSDLEEIKVSLSHLESLCEETAADSGQDVPETIAAVRRFVELSALLESPTRSPAYWISAEAFEKISSSLEILCHHIQSTEDAALFLNDFGDSWKKTDPRIYVRLMEILTNLESLGFASLPHEMPFMHFVELVDLFKDEMQTLENANTAVNELELRMIGVQETMTIGRASILEKASEIAGAANRPDAIWFTAIGIQAAKDALSAIQPLVEDYRERMLALSDVFTSAVEDLDVESLFDADSGKPMVSPFGKGKRNRRLVESFVKDGKLSKEVRSRLVPLRDVQRLRKTIDGKKQEAAALGDHYFQGAHTDIAALLEALNSAEQAIRMLEGADPARLAEAIGIASVNAAEISELGEQVRKGLAIINESSERFGGNSHDSSEALLTLIQRGWTACHLWGEARSIMFELVPAQFSFRVDRVIELCRMRKEYQDKIEAFDSRALEWRQLLGEEYLAEDTDRHRVSLQLSWARSVRENRGGRLSTGAAIRLLERGLSSIDDLTSKLDEFDLIRSRIISLFTDKRQLEIHENIETDFSESTRFIDNLIATIDQIREQVELSDAITELRSLNLGAVVDYAVARRIVSSNLRGTFFKAVYAAWIDAVIAADKTRLQPLGSKSRNSEVSSFAELDRKLRSHASAKVTESASNSRPQTTIGAMGMIQREAQKKSRHMRISDLLAGTTEVVQRIAPCFMMSPLSVSTFLPSNMVFDVVIFDEASQILTSNAVNCVYRGRQLIVAGDEKQMPPSSFFNITNEVDDESDDDGIDDFESLLYQANAGGFENLGLRWHYRSRHESLITYSNQSFYRGELITYPSARGISDELGVSFIHVPDGVYLRSGRKTNPIEAAKVAERVIYHADNNPALTLGVVAFSVNQADEINNALEFALRDRPDLDDYFTSDRLNGFFIKNLENVQGDERDIIIFSVGYGKDENQKLTMHFGPINKAKGWRRLNVAFTRARCRVELVSSITASDFTDVTNESVNYLRTYLDYAARGPAALAWATVPQTGETESVFEEEVVRVIQSWGYQVDAQVGQAGYRIDIGVRDLNNPGSYILGIECDGAAYHSSLVARDRDRLRQEVLEGLGWNFYRIWGPTWFQSRRSAEGELKMAIQEAARNGPLHASPQTNYHSASPLVEESHRVETSTIEVELRTRPSWIEPYFKGRLTQQIFVRPDATGRTSNATLDELILAIVEREGPVDRAIVHRRSSNFLSINLTKSVRDRIDQRLNLLLANTQLLHLRPDCYALPNEDLSRVREFDPSDELTKRSAKAFPAIELETAIYRILQESGPIDRKELYNVVVKSLLGLPSLTFQWTDRLDEELDALSGKYFKVDGSTISAIPVPEELQLHRLTGLSQSDTDKRIDGTY